MPPPTSPAAVNRDETPVRGRGTTPVRDRGDACPGALRLHTADDGRLARLRLPGGLLTSRQALVIGRAAEELGDGHLDITSRGNVQLRGLAEACAGPLARTLYAAGLLPSERHERVRNIVASPLAGLDGPPTADVQSWTTVLDALLCGSEPAAGLSGRFLFALDDGRGDVAALGADVTLLAEPARAAALLRIGTPGTWLRLPACHAPRAALVAAETFLTTARGSGAWRVGELPAGHGLAAAVAAALDAAGLPTEPTPAPDTAPSNGRQPALGVIAPPGGDRAALSVHAPLGRLTAAQWSLLATASATLRITPWRGVVVPGLDPAAAEDLRARAASAGLVTSEDSPWHGVGACTGRPGCAKALADVRSDAAEAVRAAAPGGAGAGLLPVHWSGCERRCGHPQGPYVDRLATGEGTYTTRITTVTR